jgi:hypothetical protein
MGDFYIQAYDLKNIINNLKKIINDTDAHCLANFLHRLELI